MYLWLDLQVTWPILPETPCVGVSWGVSRQFLLGHIAEPQVLFQDFKICTYLSEHMYQSLFEEIPLKEGARLGRLCDG